MSILCHVNGPQIYICKHIDVFDKQLVIIILLVLEVRNRAKIRNQYNQTNFLSYESAHFIIGFISKCWFERNNELTSLSSCTFKAFKGFQLPHSLFQKGLAYKTVWSVKHRSQLFQTNDAVNK